MLTAPLLAGRPKQRKQSKKGRQEWQTQTETGNGIGFIPRKTVVCRVVLNMFFFSPEWAGAADELQVLPIAWKTEMTSQDYTEWYNFEFEYCNQVCTSLAPLSLQTQTKRVTPDFALSLNLQGLTSGVSNCQLSHHAITL